MFPPFLTTWLFVDGVSKRFSQPLFTTSSSSKVGNQRKRDKKIPLFIDLPNCRPAIKLFAKRRRKKSRCSLFFSLSLLIIVNAFSLAKDLI